MIRQSKSQSSCIDACWAIALLQISLHIHLLCARINRYQCSNHIKYGDNGVLRLVASEPLRKGDEVGRGQALSWKLAGPAGSDTCDNCRHCVRPLLCVDTAV